MMKSEYTTPTKKYFDIDAFCASYNITSSTINDFFHNSIHLIGKSTLINLCTLPYDKNLEVLVNCLDGLSVSNLLISISPWFSTSFSGKKARSEQWHKTKIQHILTPQRVEAMKKQNEAKFYEAIISSDLFIEAYLVSNKFSHRDIENLLTYVLIDDNRNGFLKEVNLGIYSALISTTDCNFKYILENIDRKIFQPTTPSTSITNLADSLSATKRVDLINTLDRLIPLVESVFVNENKTQGHRYCIYALIKLLSLSKEEMFFQLNKKKKPNLLKAYIAITGITPLDIIQNSIAPRNIKKQAIDLMAC